jgi:hypothetical protein
MTNKYTIKESTYKNHPVIIPLYDGKEIHELDPDFQFGISKAKILISCMDIIKEFLAYRENEKLDETNKSVIRNNLLINYRYNNSFIGKFNKKVNKQVLHFWWENRYGSDGIRFGRKKAEAIYYLESEIKNWIKKHTS